MNYIFTPTHFNYFLIKINVFIAIKAQNTLKVKILHDILSMVIFFYLSILTNLHRLKNSVKAS